MTRLDEQTLKEKMEGGGGAGLPITRVKDEGLLVWFLHDPNSWSTYRTVFDEANQRGIILEDGQPSPIEKKKPQEKYLANVVIEDDEGGYRVLAFDMPYTLANAVYEAYKEEGTITDRWWKCTKKGQGKKGTRYFAMPKAPNGEIDPDDYEQMDLEELIEQMKLSNPGAGSETPTEYDEEEQPPRAVVKKATKIIGKGVVKGGVIKKVVTGGIVKKTGIIKKVV